MNRSRAAPRRPPRRQAPHQTTAIAAEAQQSPHGENLPENDLERPAPVPEASADSQPQQPQAQRKAKRGRPPKTPRPSSPVVGQTSAAARASAKKRVRGRFARADVIDADAGDAATAESTTTALETPAAGPSAAAEIASTVSAAATATSTASTPAATATATTATAPHDAVPATSGIISSAAAAAVTAKAGAAAKPTLLVGGGVRASSRAGGGSARWTGAGRGKGENASLSRRRVARLAGCTGCLTGCVRAQDPEGAGRGDMLTHSLVRLLTRADRRCWWTLRATARPAPPPKTTARGTPRFWGQLTRQRWWRWWCRSRRAQARWLAVRGRRVLPQDRVPDRLPVPAAQGETHRLLHCLLACLVLDSDRGGTR